MFRFVPRAVVMVFALSLSILGNPLAGLAQEATPAAECVETTPEENKALAMTYWEEVVWGDQGTINEVVAPDEVHHWGIFDDTTGFDAFQERMETFIAAFPDMEFTVDLIAAEGDLVATAWTATGTHSGEWQGIAPTGREIDYNGINIFRIECGLIAESWGEADHLGLRQQLGATDVPPPLATAAAEAAAVAPAATPCPDDTPEANTALAVRRTADIFNNNDFDALDAMLHPETVHHGGSFPDARGIDVVKGALSRLNVAYPDITMSVDMTIADGDLVAVRWSGSGTHEGPYRGMEPTGAHVMFTGINFYKIDCGLILESWSELNDLEVVRQMQEASGAATPEAAAS